MHMHAQACKFMQTHSNACECIQMHAYAFVCMHMHSNACLCIQMHAYAFMCMHSHAFERARLSSLLNKICQTFIQEFIAHECTEMHRIERACTQTHSNAR